MDEWSLQLHNTITGDLEHDFGSESVSGGSWKSLIETGGTVNGTLQVTDKGLREIGQAALHELTDPSGRFSLVASCDDVLVAAGVLLVSGYDRDAGSLSLQAKDIGDVFWPQRMTAGVNNREAGSLTITNRSYSGAVRAILQRATNQGATWALPIDLPDDSSGTFTGHWDWWEFKKISELIKQVRDEGYRVHHQPYKNSAGKLRWSTVVAKKITAGTMHLSVTAEESPVTGLSYRRSGIDRRTGKLMVGTGKGSKIQTRWAGVAEPNVPVRDSYESGTGITDMDRLQRTVTASYNASAKNDVEWGFSINAEGDFHPAQFLAGTDVTLACYDEPLIPDGEHRLYISSASGDFTSRKVTPEVVPNAD